MRFLVGITGASGAVYGVSFLKRCPGEKFLVVSKWGEEVIREEVGIDVNDLSPFVKKTFPDDDLAAPFSSGSNRYDALIIIPCSLSTLGKIANGITDTLITRAAQVALKERIKVVVALRETPLSTIAIENALTLSREGVVIMPISPPHYKHPASTDEIVNGFIDKILPILGVSVSGGWKAEELE